MGSTNIVRLSWAEICSNSAYRGRWIALDGVRYDEATARPAEGAVIDCDADLAELCGRLRSTNRRCCAIVHCDTPESAVEAMRPMRPHRASMSH